MPQQKILIVKASGETEPFSEEKLRRSLLRAGATASNAEKIIGHIVGELKNKTTTQQIYRHAFSLLRKYERPVAGRYSLKQSIMKLGPGGHAFERLVGELFNVDGFSVEVGKIVLGSCVSHEIDVIALKENKHIMVECKFHNQPGVKSDIKIALYVQARFEDVQKVWLNNPGHADKFHEVWLVTNTKLTSEAIRYADCVGMKVLGWDHPAGDGIEVRIDRAGIHPITCLTTISESHKQQLIKNKIVFCKELISQKHLLKSLGLTVDKVLATIEEIHQLCHIK